MSIYKIAEQFVLNKLKKLENGRLRLSNHDGEVFNFGKNKGKPFKEVFEMDARYIDWIIDKGEFSTELKVICRKLVAKFKSEENKNIEMPY